MYHFFADRQIGNRLYIDDKDEIHHISKVLRLKVGELVELSFNNYNFLARLESFNSSIEFLEIEKKEHKFRRIALIQAIPKSGKLEEILKRSTEVGATEILLFQGDRSIGKFKKEKLERYKSILKSASKQSKANLVTELKYLNKLEDVTNVNFDILFICDENLEEYQRIENLKGKNIGIIIGPEGGFSNRERQICYENLGCKPFYLGSRILRTETAGIKALSIIDYLEEVNEN